MSDFDNLQMVFEEINKELENLKEKQKNNLLLKNKYFYEEIKSRFHSYKKADKINKNNIITSICAMIKKYSISELPIFIAYFKTINPKLNKKYIKENFNILQKNTCNKDSNLFIAD